MKQLVRLGVVSLSVVSAPESVSVCSVLFLAVAYRVKSVFVGDVSYSVRVEQPRTENAWVISEYFLEFLKQHVAQLFSLFLCVSYRESAVRVPVPRETSCPLESCRLYLRLYRLVPYAYLKPRGVKTFHQLDKLRVDERVILHEERSAEVVLFDELYLLFHGSYEIHRCARFAGSYEVDYIYDFMF